MSAFEAVKRHLESGETPLITGSERFLTAVIDREKTERVSSRTKRVTRWKEPRYTDVHVVFTDRRMLRLGSLQPTGESYKSRPVWKVLDAVEAVPFADFRRLEVTDTTAGFRVEADPFLYRDTRLSIEGGSPSASGIPALRRVLEGGVVGPEEDRREALLQARERYLALRKEEHANQGTSAARFGLVFGGLGVSLLSSSILLYTTYCLLWGMVTMVTASSDYMVDKGVKALFCNTPWVVVMGALAFAGLFVAALNARTFFGARSNLDRVRREIVALRQQSAGG